MVLERKHESEVELALVPHLDQIEFANADVSVLEELLDVLCIVFRFHRACLVDEACAGLAVLRNSLRRALERIYNCPFEAAVFGILGVLVDIASVQHVQIINLVVHVTGLGRLHVDIVRVE